MFKRLILLFIVVVLPSVVIAQTVESTAADRKDVSVTIYNENLGLIREVRSLGIPKGIVSLRFQDVASAIDPTSVSIEVQGGLGGFELLEQNYEFDLMSPDKLMEKYVGREVELFVKHPQTGEETSIRAELLSMKGGPVYRIGDKIHIGHPGRVVVPELPDNLIARPTLVWLIDGRGGDGEIETSYLTSGMNWKADYVALLGVEDRTMDITGWVTLTNRSGAGFENAKLKLVAGKIHRAVKKRVDGPLGDGRIMKAAAEVQMEEEPFFEYHLYSLNRRTTLKDNQTKQVELLRADEVGVKKEYILQHRDLYLPALRGRIGEVEKRHPNVRLTFINERGNNLGVPLPAGVFRFYKKDSGGSLQLVGEDRVKHVPEGEKVSLYLGEAFDIVTERVITDYDVISKEVYEYESKITIRNSKDEDIEIRVVEPVRGDWEILRSSYEAKKESARTASFTVPVNKKGESVLTYRVRVKEL